MEPSRSGLNFGHHITNGRYRLSVAKIENIIGYLCRYVQGSGCWRSNRNRRGMLWAQLTFEEWEAWHYEEETSDDSVNPHLNGRARNATELEQEECHAKLQRESLRFMLANNQINVTGYRVWCPLGKYLPNCKKNGWKSMSWNLQRSNHARARKQEDSTAPEHYRIIITWWNINNTAFTTHHMTLLLRFYILGGEGPMVQHEPVNGYSHNNVGVQPFIDKIEVHHAPCHSVRNCVSCNFTTW